ncbi:hypothetical protein ILP97_17455 [Amycolatopsis sp. H6(2020)]|nr:hypothetical protein [Amycolatopsis sp. H6(2020)]
MSTAQKKATPTGGKRTRTGHTAGRSRPRGSIDRLDSGSIRVRVNAGADPITGKRHRPTVIVPPGPDDQHQAEVALTRLLKASVSDLNRSASTTCQPCALNRLSARSKLSRYG